MFRRTATEVVDRPATTTLAIKPNFLEALPSSVKPAVLASIQAARELQELEAIKLPRGTPRQQRNIYSDRVAQLRVTADASLRILVALKRGYQPYTIPAAWYGGYVEKPRGVASSWFVFNRPMPPDVLAKYVPLKREGLFDEFLVGAPDEESFTLQETKKAPRSYYIEPVLVGYIALGNLSLARSSVEPHIRMKGGIGFLIAYWDLENDLREMEV